MGNGLTVDEFVTRLAWQLEQSGYVNERCPRLPGLPALLYARSPGRISLGFAKVENHFLFMDWETQQPDGLAQIKASYRQFSGYVNQGFKVPHGWRITIPNLAVVAVSTSGFPEAVLAFARSTSLNPWYGGEVGQVILVDIGNQQVTSLTSLSSGRYPRSGALPLGHASGLIRKLCEQVFNEQS